MPRMIATSKPKLIPVSKRKLEANDVFRENLRSIMAEKKVSQVELAERLSVVRGRPTSRESVKQLLNGDHSPAVEWIDLCCRCLGVKRSELLPD